jgi:tetratricopeptide (TPR) repeat protein
VLAHPTLFGEPRAIGDRIVSLVDVFPTVIDLLVAESAPGVDGRHLLAEPAAGERAIYFESMEPLLRNGWAPLRGLRTLNDKLIEAPEPEYYVLGDDPGERRNRFASAAAAAGRLAGRLRSEFGDPDPAELLPPGSEIDPQVAGRLAALGYVSARSPVAGPTALRDPKRMLPLWNRIDDVYALAEQQRLDEALRVIDLIVAGDPGNGRAWLVRGMLLQGLGRLGEAEASVRTSARLLPGADSFARLAEILYLQDRFDEGDAAVAEAGRLDPGSGMVYIAEGVGSALRRRYDDAARAFDRAREIDPANAATRAEELAALLEEMRAAPSGTLSFSH